MKSSMTQSCCCIARGQHLGAPGDAHAGDDGIYEGDAEKREGFVSGGLGHEERAERVVGNIEEGEGGKIGKIDVGKNRAETARQRRRGRSRNEEIHVGDRTSQRSEESLRAECAEEVRI